MKTYSISDAFSVRGKGTVLVLEMDELASVTGNAEEAHSALSPYVQTGNWLSIQESGDRFEILAVERFGQLMHPMLYGKKVGLLVGESVHSSVWYIGKTASIFLICR